MISSDSSPGGNPLTTEARSKPRPEVVLLDAVGTVLQPYPSVAAAYQAIGREAGIEIDAETIGSRFREAISRYNVFAFQSAEGAADAYVTDEAIEYRRWQSIVDHVLSPKLTQRHAVFEALWHHFSVPRSWRVYDDVKPALMQLRQAGYRLGLASNFDRRLEPIVEELLPEVPLELFISSQVGWVKPCERFYFEVALRLDVAPQEILLIGDDYENDVSAPRQCGWQAWFLDRSESSELREPTQLATLTEASARLCEASGASA